MPNPLPKCPLAAFIALLLAMSSATVAAQSALSLELRSRVETSSGSGRFHTEWSRAEWQAGETAIILCDMWDAHHSVTAVRRLTEFAPRVNQVLHALRRKGGLVIHAPSDCMEAYRGHPARRRALAVPAAADALPDIATWCHRIPGEEGARYPIDQSDGGEDEDAWENAQWARQLEAQGRNPGTPWKKQTPLVEIADGDYIAAEGDVVWNVLRARGIRHVILAGVHTNMCVLGRPFGLRQMVRAGMDTALLRDCTDVMYNPERWPYVSHFTGLDLVIDHIEANVCPTLTSDQIVGGLPFRFSQDHRPRLLMVIAEDEYATARTLPEFAQRFLGGGFCVRHAFASASDNGRHDIRGLRQLSEADMLLVSVRRRALRAEDREALESFVSSGKPVLGIRTASHAFAPAGDDSIPEGHVSWPEFDRSVLGGNYHGHHGNKGPGAPASFAWTATAGGAHPPVHPIARGLPGARWKTSSWLYKVSPLAPGTQVLLEGAVEGREPAEPLAWTYTRADGGRTFYTSLGHPDDFASPEFQRLLSNAVFWAAGLDAPETLPAPPDERRFAESGWSPLDLAEFTTAAPLRQAPVLWLRTLVRMPAELPAGEMSLLLPPGVQNGTAVYCNGQAVASDPGNAGVFALVRDYWQAGQLNLITLRFVRQSQPQALEQLALEPPVLRLGGQDAPLVSRWQVAGTGLEHTAGFAAFPIPPQFGAPTDLIHEWPF